MSIRFMFCFICASVLRCMWYIYICSCWMVIDPFTRGVAIRVKFPSKGPPCITRKKTSLERAHHALRVKNFPHGVHHALCVKILPTKPQRAAMLTRKKLPSKGPPWRVKKLPSWGPFETLPSLYNFLRAPMSSSSMLVSSCRCWMLVWIMQPVAMRSAALYIVTSFVMILCKGIVLGASTVVLAMCLL